GGTPVATTLAWNRRHNALKELAMSSAYDSSADRLRPNGRSPSASTLLFLLVLAGAGYTVWQYWPQSGNLQPDATPRAVMARGELANIEKTNIEIYEQTAPSVAHVTRLAAQRDRFTLDLRQIPEGTGSGFVWDDQGHIVTNNHVVEGTNVARVT